MARHDNGRQTWALLRCAKCSGNSAQPFRATCVNSRLIQVDVRCPDCQHVWQLVRDEGAANDPPTTRPVRAHARKALSRR